MQPLVFEAFWTRPRLHHTVWNALLKVIFRDLELAMRASLTQRDGWVESARQDVSEMRRALDLVLNKQVADESQRQAEHRTVVRLLAAWRTKMSGSAQEMGTPLNVIIGQAELLLEQTKDGETRVALQSIVRQAERLILLREQLCSLDHGLGRERHASDSQGHGGRASSRMLKSHFGPADFRRSALFERDGGIPTGCSKRPSRKAAASEGPRRAFCGTLKV